MKHANKTQTTKKTQKTLTLVPSTPIWKFPILLRRFDSLPVCLSGSLEKPATLRRAAVAPPQRKTWIPWKFSNGSRRDGGQVHHREKHKETTQQKRNNKHKNIKTMEQKQSNSNKTQKKTQSMIYGF